MIKIKVIYLFLLLISVFSCGTLSEEETDYGQMTLIEDYLDSNSITYSFRDNVYSVDMNSESVDTSVILEVGDSVYINYAAYLFSSGQGSLFGTNISDIAEENGFTSIDEYEPLGIKYGVSEVIQGLTVGLRSSSVGDSTMLYMPSGMAYGDRRNGVVPEYSSIMMFVDVVEIVK
ncbi:MAG: FKBP-type peptidyl-prolyl cis-trans isomerase [Rikenellaceae bacterium]